MFPPRNLELQVLNESSRKAIYPSRVEFDGQIAWAEPTRLFKAI